MGIIRKDKSEIEKSVRNRIMAYKVILSHNPTLMPPEMQ